MQWAGCPETGSVVGTNPPTSNCKCSKDTVLFKDKPRLDNIASLPQSLGGTISWFPGYEPTRAISTETPSTTTTRITYSTISSATTSDDPTKLSSQTPTSSATVPPESGLSVGEKAGIGVGSSFGALAVGCLIIIAVILQKRKAKTNENPSSQPSLPTIEPGPAQSSVLGGFKAELPASEPHTASTRATYSIPSSPISTQSLTPSPYQPYNPGVCRNNRSSNVSQLSSGTHGGSESLVSALSPLIPEDPHSGVTEYAHSRVGQSDTIHELQ